MASDRCSRTRGVARALANLVLAFGAGLAPLAPAIAQSAPAAQPSGANAAPGADAAPAETPPPPAPPAPSVATVSEAEAAPTSQLQEIVVTSTRRAELMSKVPISVSAFTEESLDLRGAKDIGDVVRFTPGINIDADGTNNISIRGISSSAGASTTGIYIDDTPIQMRQLGFNADDALPKAFDLDRIEVLRGPQGTLFGAGAEGGAVRYIMHQPNMGSDDLYTRSELSFTQNGAPSYEAGIAGGAPIVDNVLGFRASIWYRHDGGWISRVNPYDTNSVVARDTNSENTLAVRLAAKWAINDSVAVTPSLIYQDRVSNDVSTFWPILSDPNDESFVSGWPLGRKEPDRYFLPALNVEADLGPATLVSNTSYFTRYELSGYDGTTYNLGYYQTFTDPNNPSLGYALPSTYFPFITGAGLNPNFNLTLQGYRANGQVTNQQQTFAQEFRLQSNDNKAALLWTVGVFYSETQQSSTEEIQDPMLASFLETAFALPSSPDPVAYLFGVPLLPNGDSYYNHNETKDAQLALYGEATYAITEKLKATAGLRVSRTTVTFDNFASGPQNFGVTGGPGWEAEKPVTPKFSLQYQADRDDMYYATYAKGFRPGGADPPIPFAPCAQDFANLGLSASPSSYHSDWTDSYEIGAKNLLGERFRMASSLYYIRWNNIQQNIYLPTCGFQFVANSGTAVSKGGDVQIDWAATSSLSFELAVGNTDARFTENAGTPSHLIASAGDAVEGQSLGATPPWTIALGTQYDFNAMDHKSFVRLDYEFEGHSDVKTPTQDPNTAQYDPYYYTAPSNSFVSLRAGTTFNKWQFQAFCDNVFDAHPIKIDSSDPNSTIYTYTRSNGSTFTPSSLVSAYSNRPRTIGVTVLYHLH